MTAKHIKKKLRAPNACTRNLTLAFVQVQAMANLWL